MKPHRDTLCELVRRSHVLDGVFPTHAAIDRTNPFNAYFEVLRLFFFFFLNEKYAEKKPNFMKVNFITGLTNASLFVDIN